MKYIVKEKYIVCEQMHSYFCACALLLSPGSLFQVCASKHFQGKTLICLQNLLFKDQFED